MSSSEKDSMHQLACETLKFSYAPYSTFQVAACIRSVSGKLYSGCNIENASYSLTLCAEAAAIAQMVSQGERKIADILIISSSEDLCPPCGACRQRIAEFANPNTQIHLANKEKIMASYTLDALLPHCFALEKNVCVKA